MYVIFILIKAQLENVFLEKEWTRKKRIHFILFAANMQLEGADVGKKSLQKHSVNHTINSINSVIISLILTGF